MSSKIIVRGKKRYPGYKKKLKMRRKLFRKIPRKIGFEANVMAKKFRFTHLVLNDHTATGFALYSYNLYDPANVCNRFDAGAGYTISAVNDYLSSGTTTPQSSEFLDYANLYDLMRVVGVQFNFVPASTQATTASNYQNSFLWTFWDPDNTSTSVPNVTSARLSTAALSGSTPYFMDYKNIKKHQLTKPFKRYIKCPKKTSGASGTTFSVFNTMDSKGFYNTAARLNNGFCYLFQKDMIGVGATAAVVDNVLGEMTVTYYVLFKHRV